MPVGYAEARNIVFHKQLHRSHDITMKNLLAQDKETALGEAATIKKARGRLFFLEASDGGRIFSANPDGSDRKVIVTGSQIPDGLVVDAGDGHIYSTNMGVPHRNDGSIECADVDGQNRKTIIPEGATFTPKQLHLEAESRKLYWCDREGMRVMRANLDGSSIETLVETSNGEARPGTDQTKWCVGITVDPEGGKFYWTQKGGDDAGQGRIFRANIDSAIYNT
jgi:sugar lactone lactonase YvrE